MASPANYPIESVENAARVLLMLRDKPALRVAEVAAELGIARSSAHRMLTTLQSQGLLRRDPTARSYSAGPQLVEIGSAVIGATDLRAEFRPTLERLAHEVGETIHLIILEGTSIVFLDGIEGRFAIRAADRTGDRAPAHASAAGKALLAALAPEQLRERYPESRLRGGTDEAVRTRRKLAEELDVIRAKGYALNLGESELGLHAVAACVRDAAGQVRAAISISGPSMRLSEAKLVEHGQTLMEAADQVYGRSVALPDARRRGGLT